MAFSIMTVIRIDYMIFIRMKILSSLNYINETGHVVRFIEIIALNKNILIRIN